MKTWLALLVLMSNGCIPLIIRDALRDKHRAEAEHARVVEAVKARDVDTLEGFIDHLDWKNNNELARTEYLRLRHEQLVAASCAEVERDLGGTSHRGSDFMSFARYATDPSYEQKVHDEVLAKVADCKSPWLFSKTVLGSDIVGAQLVTLEKQGHPVLDAFLALAHSREHDYVESATFTWLNQTKGAESCHIFEAVGADNDATRDFLLGFYTTKGCEAEAVRAARVLVSSQFASARLHACNAMRVLGNSSLLPQMKILAENDTSQNLEWTAYEGWLYTFVVATSVTYPVREACQEAINDLRIKRLSSRSTRDRT